MRVEELEDDFNLRDLGVALLMSSIETPGKISDSIRGVIARKLVMDTFL